MTQFMAITFRGRKTASKALDAVEESNDHLWLDDIAVVSRSKHGYLRVHSTWAQDDSIVKGSAGWGAITGGLLGAMIAPAGAIGAAIGAGAIGGGSLGALFGAGTDLAVEDPILSDFAASLKDDTSAVVLVSDSVAVDEFGRVFEPFEGSFIETELNEHDIKALKEAVKANRARA
ncbi:MAG: DUF1269 domain-containing protein [Myxococcales bacterium]|nr:DUF1269 domain-containing protein [Myxococcales bacterium]MDH3844453.1 DUF1269 domain-containing protein [Myxococcales bacterium]